MNGKVKNVGLVSGGISLAFLINFAIGYGEVKEDVKHNTKEVEKVEMKVAKNTEDIDKEENTNIDQTAILRGLLTSVTELNRQMMTR